MEVLEKPTTHFLPHALRNEPRIWGVCSEEVRIAPLETARRCWNGAMLTTCPNCLHVFDQPLSSSCCASSRSAHDPSPPSHPHPPHLPPPPDSASAPAGAASASAGAMGLADGAAAGAASAQQLALAAQQQQQQQLQLQLHQSPPLLLSATLQLPPSAVPTTCTLAVTAAEPSHRALAGLAGGGIVLQQHHLPLSQDATKMSTTTTAATTTTCLAPQPSPSAPLSFVLPPASGASRPPGGGASVLVNVQVPATTPALLASLTTSTSSSSSIMTSATTSTLLPQTDGDLERLAATMDALRTSGWYYEGLSWQESADLLQATAPGTFLVRDSSDPRFLFSLSVQTERGPTSIRLHYVCGSFRLDAEPRLAPLMPLFGCVVQLVEHYVEMTRHRRGHKPPRDKEQVWVDARGQMYSHILLRSPLYKRSHLPNLQHLARLAINKQLRAASRTPAVDAARLPLPAPLQAFVEEYPYTS